MFPANTLNFTLTALNFTVTSVISKQHKHQRSTKQPHQQRGSQHELAAAAWQQAATVGNNTCSKHTTKA